MSVSLSSDAIVEFFTTDPLGVGFAAILSGSPGQDAPLIEASNNQDGLGAGQVAGDPMSSPSFFDLIDANDYDAFTAIELAKLNTIMSPGSVNLGSSVTQSKLNNLLANYAASLAAVSAKYNRKAGPWEVYFGKGSVASTSVIDDARNSNGGNRF